MMIGGFFGLFGTLDITVALLMCGIIFALWAY